MLHDPPYAFQINAFISVDQNVSETGHQTHEILRMRSTVCLRHSFRRFTNNLKIADHSILKHRIVVKFFLAALSVALDFLRAFQNVGEVDTRIFLHKGLASFKMRRSDKKGVPCSRFWRYSSPLKIVGARFISLSEIDIERLFDDPAVKRSVLILNYRQNIEIGLLGPFIARP